ncbi:MAG: hypothetical protein KME50_29725 [Nostoc desertorum CM1-VF14]|jgi:hypothetical protein|nr:hypothetical protein [Nostoc desertorum CM1-VF14]
MFRKASVDRENLTLQIYCWAEASQVLRLSVCGMSAGAGDMRGRMPSVADRNT